MVVVGEWSAEHVLWWFGWSVLSCLCDVCVVWLEVLWCGVDKTAKDVRDVSIAVYVSVGVADCVFVAGGCCG